MKGKSQTTKDPEEAEEAEEALSRLLTQNIFCVNREATIVCAQKTFVENLRRTWFRV